MGGDGPVWCQECMNGTLLSRIVLVFEIAVIYRMWNRVVPPKSTAQLSCWPEKHSEIEEKS